ncbi:UDP-2,3-diacetamido-2,3-dideoxy-D-glucuronate 2-epimerase [Patiriisocius marinistellae]|uniref:UDP-2,3-diacetamido-2,3-dideoxy-D-glucuronate 2-epimerase n=1 Tax=Patiriisocius marinistellae TaxID=2494560 RepID=A0A5J4G0H1_9FLAO|nr:UDP-N-acetylglucosamine 2-epimerase (non-hydrolyzing) [Patiriisocius marinistellae]GEQ87208.1 UDP-2,3-diacetamido-2,3-dideoxy-D-glucuronate 2-epimerase [Patiriisocius marinistellae]
MKIITIIGARPQFIKSAAISKAVLEYSAQHPKAPVEEIIVHTGQHYDANMSGVFFEQMNIPKPKYQLNINGLSHGAMTGQMLEAIEKILINEQPQWVLVHGDTNSTLAGALAARKLHIKVAHIEAGLRSFNERMPEEANRILTDRMSTLLFVPTDSAIENLKKEGYDYIGTKVVKNGDVMLDASLVFTPFAKKPSDNLPENFILSTIHRAENTDDPKRLNGIFNALNKIAEKDAIVIPLHPRTKSFIEKYAITLHKNIFCIEPVGYLEMLYLLNNCTLVMTDSGGLQKEAFFFKKFCLTMRDDTEWVELVNNGYNTLVGADTDKIIAAYTSAGNTSLDFSKNLYGTGDASQKIIDGLVNFTN